MLHCLLVINFFPDLYQQCRHYQRPYPATASQLKASELLLGYTEAFAWINNSLILVFLEFSEVSTLSGATTIDMSVLVGCLVAIGLCTAVSDVAIWIRGGTKSNLVAILEKRFAFRARKVMNGAKEKKEAYVKPRVTRTRMRTKNVSRRTTPEQRPESLNKKDSRKPKTRLANLPLQYRNSTQEFYNSVSKSKSNIQEKGGQLPTVVSAPVPTVINPLSIDTVDHL